MNDPVTPVLQQNKPARGPDGRVLPGGPSLNPGGRPRTVFRAGSHAAQFTEQMLNRLVEIASGETRAPATAQVQAANIVLHVAGAFLSKEEPEGTVTEKLAALLRRDESGIAAEAATPPVETGSDDG